jgi:glycosyltransferase involved in cell wall biosynthesis/GT2 family glycosyltransferase
MRLGFIEPHLRRYGGIRRMLEFANRLVARGHDVSFFLPVDGASGPAATALRCDWMECGARIRPLHDGFDAPLDVVVFNHEPQWHLLERFERADRRIFYALHYGRLYGKEGSWESLRVPVDLILANSHWTAEQIHGEIGTMPVVQLGGVNRSVFRPHVGRPKYDILCSGETQRAWKGTETILEAGRILGTRVERYARKNLEQSALGREYAAARVFAVGSWFEGFCQPGLEALACGTPLVTTDNGGCREYAINGETALVVEPRDAKAMAGALRRVLGDRELAARLARNGLDLVARDFDWERRTDEFEALLDGVIARPSGCLPRLAASPSRGDTQWSPNTGSSAASAAEGVTDDGACAPLIAPVVSIVVLAWDNLAYTQQFVDSVRRTTTVPYELIVVDNGSAWEAVHYAQAAADVAILNATNLGFAKGMNQGLVAARGEYVLFCNNDTVLPEGWDRRLLETAARSCRTGIVVPAVTEARNDATVRSAPGDDVTVLPTFSAPPPAIVYLMRRELMCQLGGWCEDYEVASGEDVDLCFAVWVNDLDIVFDSRVLVHHVGKGTASRLDDWQGLWARNRRRFLDKWGSNAEVPRLASCDDERFERNRRTAVGVAAWMDRYFRARDREEQRSRRLFARNGPVRSGSVEVARKGWRRIRPHLPPRMDDRFVEFRRRTKR